MLSQVSHTESSHQTVESVSTSEATSFRKTSIKKSERKGSVMIEASLNIPDEKISEVQVKKDGVVVQTKEEQSHSKISISRKVSTASQQETVLQLEIENAKPEDEGKYEIVAKDEMGEVRAKKVSITKKQIHQVAVAGVEKIDIPDGAPAQREVQEEGPIITEPEEPEAVTEPSPVTEEVVSEVQERKMSKTEEVAIKEEVSEEKPQEAEASPFGVKKLRKVSRTEELKEGTPAAAAGSSKEQTPEAEASPFGLKKLRKVSRQEDTPKEGTPTKEAAQEPEKPKLRKTSKADSEQSQKDAPADEAAEALATSGVTEVKKKKKKVVKKKKKKDEPPLEPPEFSSFLKTQVWI